MGAFIGGLLNNKGIDESVEYGSASAAIVVKGKVVAAVADERLNRQKKNKGFPSLSIEYCLKEAGLNIDLHLVPGGHDQKKTLLGKPGKDILKAALQ